MQRFSGKDFFLLDPKRTEAYPHKRIPASKERTIQSTTFMVPGLQMITMPGIAVKIRQNMRYLPLILFIIIFFTTESFCSTKVKLVEAAMDRTKHQITYDGSYHSISYPNGDVPSNIGVCTDVVIRSYRKVGIDLQQLVHEDMKKNFSKYPSRRMWGLTKPDPNIDHRRVPNLQVFFSRHGTIQKISDKSESYLPGDLVTWMLPGNLPHIGIVTNEYSSTSKNPMIVHNIGRGPELEDMLFDYKITGHYRYFPEEN